ncbi:alanine-synthesizing transaminase [Nitzschia inconspicua]|uniref:Alanine-synthesizing transaminase n=1 Tax=Nitzschia inconspicua TaxID=303405 RepID=A0A9K3L2M2_9STRA|nr:alanine-synthesizing transaminase [Nitzschia inconspicua]
MFGRRIAARHGFAAGRMIGGSLRSSIPCVGVLSTFEGFLTAFKHPPSFTPHPNRRFKSSVQTNALASWQKACWMTYLASSLGSDNLFRSIDSNHDNSISAEEIRRFLDAVEHKGVHPRAFKMIDELAHDHELSNAEFKSWLILATKFGNERNSSFFLDYSRYSEVGERRPDKVDGEHDYRSWNETTMSQSIRRMQYAVRGQIVMRADELQSQGKEILFTNIGNPQAVGQPPITFFRQVIALTDLPAEVGVDHPQVGSLFPADVVKRAKKVQESLGGAGTGAYSGSQGALGFRKDVANFIAARDGHPAYPGNIFITNGASSAIEMVLTTLVSNELDGIMIPIPQYPIYSALIAKLAGRQIGYELEEENGWAASNEELEMRLHAAQAEGIMVKALAIINPGNPTGQVFSREDLEVICKFCAENEIVLLADEVYQRNVYIPTKKFLSAKKVALETPGCENLQMVSFHSTSKGVIGECGRRGGYMELHNIDPYVQSQLYKLASSGLCSNLSGQIMTSLMVNPPQPGDESYERFAQEENEIFEGLKRRSKALVDGLNAVDGITCNPAEGAMYAFPNVTLPPKAIEYADKHDMTPDTVYALSLLDETGICVVPASGFGQKEGR